MSIEKWRRSKMCPDYEVNNYGTVRNRKTKKTTYPITRGSNTLYVHLRNKDGSTQYHKLSEIVADAFCKNDFDHSGMKAFHKNENPHDNAPANLVYVPVKKKNNPTVSYRDTEVRCKETGMEYYNVYACSEEFGIKPEDIALSISEDQPVRAKDDNWYTFEHIN